jgi:hypothetical protein
MRSHILGKVSFHNYMEKSVNVYSQNEEAVSLTQ